jgi:hypothetical protein
MSGHSLAQTGASSLFAATPADPGGADFRPRIGGCMDRWIVLWRDESGDADHDCHMTADSAAEAVGLIGEVLEGETSTDDGDGMPALDAFLEHVGCEAAGLPALLQVTVGVIEFRCDDGILTVVRDRIAR